MHDTGSFTTPCELTPLPDGHNWRLAGALTFYANNYFVVTAPEGFITDLASIPRPFWNLLPPFGKYTEAAVIHDWLYRTHLFSRAMCDALFLEMMNALRTDWHTRTIIYLAVRLFGGFAWRDERRWRSHLAIPLQKL
jgi:hypothetical protein